jgi:hypothetical protein
MYVLYKGHIRLAGGLWLICSERKILLVDCCGWFARKEKYY